MTNRAANDAKLNSKNKIREQNFVPLKQSTLDKRKREGRTGTKILIDKGNLINTVKSDKSKLSFMKYGIYQNEGFTAGGMFKGANVPKREWIVTKLTKKNIDKFFKNFHSALSK